MWWSKRNTRYCFIQFCNIYSKKVMLRAVKAFFLTKWNRNTTGSHTLKSLIIWLVILAELFYVFSPLLCDAGHDRSFKQYYPLLYISLSVKVTLHIRHQFYSKLTESFMNVEQVQILKEWKFCTQLNYYLNIHEYTNKLR